MNFDIDHIRIEDVNYEALESAEILFDFPEVAMESWRDADPTKTRWVSTPYIKAPFNPYARDAMRTYYSSLAKRLIPIAKKVVLNEAEVGRVGKIDDAEIIETLASVDYNFLAKKFSDVKLSTASTFYTDSDGELQTATTVNSDLTVDKISVRRMRGDAVLIVSLTRIWLQRNFFTTPSYLARISDRLTDAMNEADGNKHNGEAFLTVHGVATDAHVASSGSASNEITLELNFVVPKKWCV